MNADFWITLLQFVGALVALIILHEFGHFIVARLMNVEVEEFGIGFPPRIATLFRAWGTNFTLNALPLGGFVRPKGENDPDVEGGLAAASPWTRLAVLFAGPFMNLLIGVLLYAVIAHSIGAADRSQILISNVNEGSPAAMAGLKSGDIIVKVDGTTVNDVNVLQSTIANHLGQNITLTYKRNGELHQTSLVPRVNPPQGQGAIGIVMGYPTRPVSWFQAIPTGIQATGDHIKLLVTLPFQMIQGQVAPSEGRFVGFKGMFDIYQEARQGDLVQGTSAGVDILLFFTNITISLGVLNLVPFPALDGGRILFTLPEILIGRRIPPEYENVINLVGFGLLLLLLIYINLQDFISPITLPK